MPSSEECYAAADKVRQHYFDYLMTKYERKAVDEMMKLVPYATMKAKFVKDTGTYTGPYSPFGD